MSQHYSSSRGASLVEVVTSVILSGVVVMAGAMLFRPAMDLSVLLTQQAGTQQAARLAVNVLTSELIQAGNGLPGGGIQLPGGSGSVDPLFACDAGDCYVTGNTYPNDRLYAVTPGDGKGPTVNTVSTDSVTIAYRDPTSNLDQLPLTNISANGDQITFDPATSPAWDDADTGVKVGDILVLCNVNGCAAGEVNKIHGVHLHLNGSEATDPDYLEFNQPAAAYGNIPSIIPAAATRAFRLLVVTFYIDNSNTDVPRLMRQVNAHAPSVASLFIENLQLSYDIFDENSATVTNNLPDAGGNPNQIRKVNISIGARSPTDGVGGGGYQHLILTTSISTRSLRFRDTY